jgi:hypothetical protein
MLGIASTAAVSPRNVSHPARTTRSVCRRSSCAISGAQILSCPLASAAKSSAGCVAALPAAPWPEKWISGKRGAAAMKRCAVAAPPSSTTAAGYRRFSACASACALERFWRSGRVGSAITSIRGSFVAWCGDRIQNVALGATVTSHFWTTNRPLRRSRNAEKGSA